MLGNRKRKKQLAKWQAAAAILLWIACLPLAAQAETLGSITLILEENISPEGISFSCTRVGGIWQGEYQLEEAFQNTGIDPNELNTSREMREAAEKLAEKAEGGILSAADEEGRIQFTDLSPGLYLLQAENSGSYRGADASLAAIPSWEEEKGSMMYDITVVPKFRPYEPEKMTFFDTGENSSLPVCAGGAAAAVLLLGLLNRKRFRGK